MRSVFDFNFFSFPSHIFNNHQNDMRTIVETYITELNNDIFETINARSAVQLSIII